MTRALFPALAVTFALAACGTPEPPPEQATADQLGEPGVAGEPAAPGAPAGAPGAFDEATSTFSGNLVEVDTDMRTLTVAEGAIERVFSFDDATETMDGRAADAPDVQGLSGSEGARVEVTYVERADGLYAQRIEFQ